jgi:hypothetical protein
MADDIQGLLKSVQDYLVRGGLDEDARYYLGPHAYEGLSNIASLANFIGPGADIKDIASESAKVMEGDPAAFANLPAALAMMALPGSKSGVDKSLEGLSGLGAATIKKTAQNLPKHKQGIKRININDELFEDVLKTPEGDPVVLYRGTTLNTNSPVDEILSGKGREQYASFLSDNPHTASTYSYAEATGDSDLSGIVVPFIVKPKKVIEYEDKYTRQNKKEPGSAAYDFDMFEFDRQAQRLGSGEVLVVRNVHDTGPHARITGPDDPKYWSYGSDVYAVKDESVLQSAFGAQSGVKEVADSAKPVNYSRGGSIVERSNKYVPRAI